MCQRPVVRSIHRSYRTCGMHDYSTIFKDPRFLRKNEFFSRNPSKNQTHISLFSQETTESRRLMDEWRYRPLVIRLKVCLQLNNTPKTQCNLVCPGLFCPHCDEDRKSLILVFLLSGVYYESRKRMWEGFFYFFFIMISVVLDKSLFFHLS